MKKKYVLFSIVIVVLLVTFVTCFNYFKTTNNYVEDNVNNQTKITKGISMNLEQTAGAGDYKTVTQSSWPTEGYKFNTELSRCENGSELSWDDTNKKVIVSGNMSDKCYVYFDKVLVLSEVCNDKTLKDCIIAQYTGTQGQNNIYYHNSSLSNGAGDNSYRYAGGDYQLTSKAISAGFNTVAAKAQTSTDGVVNYYCNGIKQYVGAGCPTTYIAYYSLQYDTTNTQYQSYKEALEKAIVDGYLIEDIVKNFVCFGTNESTCSTDNLYRIIGMIDNKVKLIKYDCASRNLLGTSGESPYKTDPSLMYLGTLTKIDYYRINDSSILSNNWSDSPLNKTNLNTSFINNMGNTWTSKIATTTWKVGGGSSTYLTDVPATAYQYEVGSNASSTTYDAKIGLMYVSDYYYAASPSAWTLVGYSSSNPTTDYRVATSINWMYMGIDDWTLTPNTSDSETMFGILSYGYVTSGFVSMDNYCVRPVFNLDTSVTYASGSGTQSDPIRIN